MKRSVRRRSTFAIVMTMVLILSVFLAACSNKSDENEARPPADTGKETATTDKSETPNEEGKKEAAPAAEEKHEPVTLKMIMWHVGIYQELFDLFHEKYPWITIEPVIQGGSDPDLIAKAAAMQAAGDPADLTWTVGLSDWTKDGLLEDLTPYIEKDQTIQNAKVVDGFLDAFKTQDKRYVIPFYSIFEFIVVNKELLQKHGMEMPGNDWTYDQFFEMAKKATDPAVNEYGISYDVMLASHFNWILPIANGHAANPYFMNEDLTQSMANTPGVLADLKWLQELTTKWHVRPSDEEGTKLGWEKGNNFLTGKVLFTLGADWVLPGYQQDAKFEWDILPLPRGKAKQATINILGPTGILSASKHKEDAFKWLSFMFDLEAQKVMAKNGSNTFVIHPEIDKAIDEAPIWKGKNTEAIKMSRTMCCNLPGPTIPEFSFYQVNVDNKLPDLMYNGGDINSIVPSVEAFNKKTLETRKLLGW